MKPSHLITPRTMNEGIWTPGYTRAQPPQRYSKADRLVLWGCSIASVCLVFILVLFPEAR